MKPEFREDAVSKHVDPTTQPYVDFDWNELYARLGEATDTDEITGQQLRMAMRPIFQWLLDIHINKHALEYVGRRTMAFAWVLCPDIFDGESLNKLSEKVELKKQVLSKLSSAISEKFGVENRGQAHGWNRGLRRSPRAKNQPPSPHSERGQTHQAPAKGIRPSPTASVADKPLPRPIPGHLCAKESFVDVPRR